MPSGKRSAPRRSGLEEIQALFSGRTDRLFPIETASELKTKLQGASTHITLASTRLDLRKLIDRIPPYYFPITSVANLAAKARYLYKQNEHRIGVPPRVAPVLKRVATELHYPVTSVDQIRAVVRRLKITTVSDGRRDHDVERALAHVPGRVFPIRSASHLYDLTRRLARARRAR